MENNIHGIWDIYLPEVAPSVDERNEWTEYADSSTEDPHLAQYHS